MSGNPTPTPAIQTAVNVLQSFVDAGRVALRVSQGGTALEIRILDPALVIPASAVGLQLLHQSTDAASPSVYGDPAAGQVPY